MEGQEGVKVERGAARTADEVDMRWFAGWIAMVVLAVVPVAHAAGRHRLTHGEARQLARLVAEHEHIDLNNQWIEFDSMDAGAPYLRGFASFTVVREAQTPGPDTTLGRYAVNRRSGNVWEMTLCRKYDFPALAALRKKLTGRAEAGAAEDAAERKDLGCLSHGTGHDGGRAVLRAGGLGNSR